MNFPLHWPRGVRRTAIRMSLALTVTALAACSSVNGVLEGDKVDYRSSGAKSSTLDVPPDLTAPTSDNRYAIP